MTEFGTLEIVTDPEPKDKESESSCPQSESTPSNGSSEPRNNSTQAETATQRAYDMGEYTQKSRTVNLFNMRISPYFFACFNI